MINRFLSARWAKKGPVGRSGFPPPPLFFIDYDVLRNLGKKLFSKIMNKIPVGPFFSSLGRWTGNNFLFKGGPSCPLGNRGPQCGCPVLTLTVLQYLTLTSAPG